MRVAAKVATHAAGPVEPRPPASSVAPCSIRRQEPDASSRYVGPAGPPPERGSVVTTTSTAATLGLWPPAASASAPVTVISTASRRAPNRSSLGSASPLAAPAAVPRSRRHPARSEPPGSGQPPRWDRSARRRGRTGSALSVLQQLTDIARPNRPSRRNVRPGDEHVSERSELGLHPTAVPAGHRRREACAHSASAAKPAARTRRLNASWPPGASSAGDQPAWPPNRPPREGRASAPGATRGRPRLPVRPNEGRSGLRGRQRHRAPPPGRDRDEGHPLAHRPPVPWSATTILSPAAQSEPTTRMRGPPCSIALASRLSSACATREGSAMTTAAPALHSNSKERSARAAGPRQRSTAAATIARAATGRERSGRPRPLTAPSRSSRAASARSKESGEAWAWRNPGIGASASACSGRRSS